MIPFVAVNVTIELHWLGWNDECPRGLHGWCGPRRYQSIAYQLHDCRSSDLSAIVLCVKSAKFFCDESGNTGPNWGDPCQRMFTHGGWLVLDSHADIVVDGFAKLREDHRIHAKDLKWRSLARKPDPAQVFRDFFRFAFENGALPFFVVADKQYLTAAKVVETFFDPVYNHHFPTSFTGDFETKKKLAETIPDASAILDLFAEQLKSGTAPAPEVIQRLACDLAEHLTAKGRSDVGATLTDFTDEEVVCLGHEFEGETWSRTTLGHTMWALIQRLERFIRPRGFRLEIRHDNIVGHDELIQIVKRLFRPSDGDDVFVIDGEIMFGSMPTTKSFCLVDSAAEPLIQMSDLLCGFLGSAFNKLRTGVKVTQCEQMTLQDLRNIKVQWDTWDLIVSNELWERLGKAINNAR